MQTKSSKPESRTRQETRSTQDSHKTTHKPTKTQRTRTKKQNQGSLPRRQLVRQVISQHSYARRQAVQSCTLDKQTKCAACAPQISSDVQEPTTAVWFHTTWSPPACRIMACGNTVIIIITIIIAITITISITIITTIIVTITATIYYYYYHYYCFLTIISITIAIIILIIITIITIINFSIIVFLLLL